MQHAHIRRLPGGLAILALAVLFQAASPALAQDCDGWWSIGDPCGRALPALAADTARGVVVMHGGIGTDSSSYNANNVSVETWEFDGERWRFRTMQGPSTRARHAMAFDARRGVTVLFGGQVFNATGAPQGNSSETWEWDGTSWTLRAVPGPSARNSHAMAYDAARERVLLYGGSAGGQELWSYDGEAWTQVPAQEVWPPARQNHSLAFDPSRSAVVLHASGSATWEWNGSAWSGPSAVAAPAAQLSSLAFDASTQRLTAAANGSGGLTFAQWDGSAWTTLPTPPKVPWSHRFCALPGGGLLTFGFPNTSFSFPAEVPGYVFRNNQLSPMPTQPAPSRREFSAMATDSIRARTILFGGSQNASPSHRDTWELRGERWTRVSDGSLADGPPASTYPGMVFDPARDEMILTSNSLWKRSSAGAWTRVTPFTSLPAFQGAGYSPAHGAMFLLNGGIMRWTGTTLSSWGPAGVESSGGHGFAFDAVRDRGIATGHQSSPFTRAFDPAGAAWSTLINSRQTSYYDPELTFDAARGGIVLFGGFLAPSPVVGNYHNRTYFLASDARAWTQLPLRGPNGRKHQSFTYDAVSERVVMFGGLGILASPPEYLNDTWILSRGPAAIARHPLPAEVEPLRQAELFVIAKGGGPIAYQWRRDGEPVLASQRVRGVDSDTLIILNAEAADAGLYTCTVTNACGSQTSDPARLGVRCAVDLDNDGALEEAIPDGAVDVNDLLYFLLAFESGVVGADLDSDGDPALATPDEAVDVNDLLFFLARFEAGC